MTTHKTILDDLGLTNVSEEEKASLTAQMAETLQNRIAARVLEVMSEDEKKEFDQIIKTGNVEAANNYMLEKVPGLELLARREFENLRAELVQENKEIMDAIGVLPEETK